MSLFSSGPFRILLILTFFIVLIGGFAWYIATLQYKKDTAHLQFVDPKDELWLSAKNLATANINTFISLCPQNPQHCFVKFSNDGPSGFKEEIWAKVLNMGPDFVTITVELRYLKNKDENPQRELPMGQIIDWMVELPDGKIKGAYTTQALLRLQLEHEQNTSAKDSLQNSLKVFADPLE